MTDLVTPQPRRFRRLGRMTTIAALAVTVAVGAVIQAVPAEAATSPSQLAALSAGLTSQLAAASAAAAPAAPEAPGAVPVGSVLNVSHPPGSQCRADFRTNVVANNYTTAVSLDTMLTGTRFNGSLLLQTFSKGPVVNNTIPIDFTFVRACGPADSPANLARAFYAPILAFLAYLGVVVTFTTTAAIFAPTLLGKTSFLLLAGCVAGLIQNGAFAYLLTDTQKVEQGAFAGAAGCFTGAAGVFVGGSAKKFAEWVATQVGRTGFGAYTAAAIAARQAAANVNHAAVAAAVDPAPVIQGVGAIVLHGAL